MMTTTKDKIKQTNQNNERCSCNGVCSCCFLLLLFLCVYVCACVRACVRVCVCKLSSCSVTIKAVITVEARYSCCGVSSFSPTGL